MTEEQKKEMLLGIINNGEKWECRPISYYCSEEQKYVDEQCDYDACAHTCRDDCYGDWRPYKLGDEIHEDWEYRKVKTWIVYGHVNNFKLTSEFDTTLNIWHKGTKEDCEKWIEEHTKKSWLEEYIDINCDDKIEAHNSKIDIKNVCKKILEEMDKEHTLCSASYYLKQIIKDLGIELE